MKKNDVVEQSFKIATCPNPILKETSHACDLLNGLPEAYHIADCLMSWSISNNRALDGRRKCVGLAAPQIGILKRVFVMLPGASSRSTLPPSICINPKIISHGNQKVMELEGCFSEPGVTLPVERWAVINVVYWDKNGWQERTLKYWEARIFQHEMDHLNGVLIDSAEHRKK